MTEHSLFVFNNQTKLTIWKLHQEEILSRFFFKLFQIDECYVKKSASFRGFLFELFIEDRYMNIHWFSWQKRGLKQRFWKALIDDLRVVPIFIK